ncbi:MAG: DUF4372 domain-containing protein [Segetibacter sp.]
MNKSTDFVGQPIFSQLLSLLDKSVIKQTIQEHKANRCYKKLFLWDHLVSMLYRVYTNCTSLREIQYGTGGLSGQAQSSEPKRCASTQYFKRWQ